MAQYETVLEVDVSRGVTLPVSGKAREVVGEARRLPQLGVAAKETLGPKLGTAVGTAKGSAKELGPALGSARDRLAPALGAAREQLVENVAPAIVEAVNDAIERSEPARAEALRRAEAALAALRGESTQASSGVRGAGVVGLLALGALLGAAGGWFAHRPAPGSGSEPPTLSPVATPPEPLYPPEETTSPSS